MVQSEVKPKPNAQAIQSNSENAPEYSYILLGQDSIWAGFQLGTALLPAEALHLNFESTASFACEHLVCLRVPDNAFCGGIPLKLAI
jgi:hypothetical protein